MPRLRNRPLRGNVSAGLYARKATTRMVIPFARSSTPDTVRVSVRCGRELQAAAPAIGCCAVTCRGRTPQTARKANALEGCDKNRRSRCCAPWHRRITTTGVARLAIIPFLSATRFMKDLIRGSINIQSCWSNHFLACSTSSSICRVSAARSGYFSSSRSFCKNSTRRCLP